MPEIQQCDLQLMTSSIEMGEGGIWQAKGHKDLGFLEHDETNWLQIEDASFWYRHRAKVFISAVSRYHCSGPFFEIGAGNGAVSIELQRSGFDVVAIEPTRWCALNAKARGVRNVICATLENVHLKPGTLENVGIFDVLEHIDDDAAYLLEMRRMMPKGGMLFCAVPAYSWLWSAEDQYAGHRRRYTLQRLSEIAKQAGFDVEYSTYFFRPLIAPIFVLRTLPTLLRIRSNRSAASSAREHSLGTGNISAILEFLLEKELSTLIRGGHLGFGASCMIVAKAR